MDAMRAILQGEFGGNQHEVRTWERGIEAGLHLMLVLLAGDAVVGFGGVQFAQTDLVVFHSDCVAPSHRRRGFGSALVLARVAMLDGRRYDAGLLALERNLRFYERFGFAADGSVIRDPALGWSFYRMERVIDAADVQNAAATLQQRGIALTLEDTAE